MVARCNFMTMLAFAVCFIFGLLCVCDAKEVTADVPFLQFPDLSGKYFEPAWRGKSRMTLTADANDTINYAIVIDSGSTGNRVHIYTYRWNKTASASPTVLAVTVAGDTWSLRTKPAINAFVNNPQNVSSSLTTVIQYAKDHLPNNTWSSVPLWLKATAGMRVLTPDQQNNIMKYVRQYLASTPFNFRSAEVIEGWQEGAFAWITVNYLSNTLGTGNATQGSLDLGGASTQIVFQPTVPILDVAAGAKILVGVGNNYTYTVYSYSYNGYGLDSVWATAMQYQSRNASNNSVVQTPCLPLGASLNSANPLVTQVPGLSAYNFTFNGTGDMVACKAVVAASLTPTTPCPSKYNGQCSGILGTYQTPIPDGYAFMAFSGYVYTRDFMKTNMGLPGMGYDLYVNGYTAYFGKTAAELQSLDPTNTFVPQFGFNAVYIAALLESLKLTNQTNTPLTIQSNMTNSDGVSLNVGWTLGAMVFEVVNDLYGPPPSPGSARRLGWVAQLGVGCGVGWRVVCLRIIVWILGSFLQVDRWVSL